MNISGAFHNLSQSFKNYCYTSQQASMAVIVEMKELRNTPDFFQKVCQVAHASLELLLMRYKLAAASLSRLSLALLTTANMHDFYRFVRHPNNWFSPVNADAIDENQVLEDMVDYLEAKGFNQDKIELRKVVKESVKAHLNVMANHGDSYRDIETFRDQVQKHLRKAKSATFDFSKVEFTDLNESNNKYSVSKWMRHVPLLDRIMNVNWIVVDGLTVTWHLKEWGFLNTAKLSNRMGQYQAFSWVKRYELEKWLVGLVCTAFAWKCLEAVRKLQDEQLTKQDRIQARWGAVTSAAELVLHSSNYMNLIGKTHIHIKYIHCFAIFAKSLGLFSLAMQRREFFPES